MADSLYRCLRCRSPFTVKGELDPGDRVCGRCLLAEGAVCFCGHPESRHYTDRSCRDCIDHAIGVPEERGIHVEPLPEVSA